MLSDAIWTLVVSHLETQLLTITGVQGFYQIDPSRGGTTSKDWVAFAFLKENNAGKFMVNQDSYPSSKFKVRLGILIADSSQEAHMNQVALAKTRLGDWLTDWYRNDTWYPVLYPNVDTIGILTRVVGDTPVSGKELSTMTWIDLEMSVNRS